MNKDLRAFKRRFRKKKHTKKNVKKDYNRYSEENLRNWKFKPKFMCEILDTRNNQNQKSSIT